MFSREIKLERNMIMEKYITQNGIKYELRGELYYPLLEILEQTYSMFKIIVDEECSIEEKLKTSDEREWG